MSSATKVGLVVPSDAIDLRGTSPSAVRVRAGKAEKVQVQIGLTDKSSETIEILTGLQAGDTLLIGAAQGITPGTPVRVSGPPATPVANGGATGGL
jgi:hypothetical protein